MELKECIEYVKKSFPNDFNPSDNTILDVAVRIYNSQNFKDKPKVLDDNSDQPKATEKQIYRLVNKYGMKEIDVEKLTKMEAMRIIQEKERE